MITDHRNHEWLGIQEDLFNGEGNMVDDAILDSVWARHMIGRNHKKTQRYDSELIGQLREVGCRDVVFVRGIVENRIVQPIDRNGDPYGLIYLNQLLVPKCQAEEQLSSGDIMRIRSILFSARAAAIWVDDPV